MIRKQVFAALALSVAAISAAHAAPVQWTGGNGHWYEFIGRSISWETARANASAASYMGMNGYLATVTSAAENTFVASDVAGGKTAWIGGSDAAKEGSFTWVDGPEAGQAVTYTNWFPGQPGIGGADQDSLQINFVQTGLWNDYYASNPLNVTQGYVVEFNDAPKAPLSVPQANNGNGANEGGGALPEPSTLALVLPALFFGLRLRRRRA